MHPVLGSVVADRDAQFATEIEGVMAGMDEGLQEMTESVEQMMHTLTISPRVHAAAEDKVAALRKDPALQEDMLRVVRGMQATLHGLRSLMEDPRDARGAGRARARPS